MISPETPTESSRQPRKTPQNFHIHSTTFHTDTS